MIVRRVVPNIPSNDLPASREFYRGFLGLDIAMDMDWIITFASPNNPTAQVSVVADSGNQSAHGVSLTVEVSDVESMHAAAQARDLDIVYPLTTEPWGVRRFHVADPNGVIVNVISHDDDAV